MARSPTSNDVSRGRDGQPQGMGDSQRHRSESTHLRDGHRPTRLSTSAQASRNDCPASFKEGDSVSVFCRSVEKWVAGTVVMFEENDLAWVEYKVGGQPCGKTMHLQSEHLRSLRQVTKSSKGLQECGAGILVYVLDCSSSRRQNHGAAKAILDELNVKQDFYELRSRDEIASRFPFTAGAIENMLVANGHVLLVGLRSTVFGGLPEDMGEESGKFKFTTKNPGLPGSVRQLWDTSADRRQRFEECLDQLANTVNALHSRISSPNNEIAFHYNMGCANAGGKWVEYEAMIQDFASTVAVEYGNKYRVAIYGCPVDES